MDFSEPRSEAKDGLRSWLVVAGNVVSFTLAIGMIRTWAVFFPPIMHEFGVDYGAVSLIPGLNFGGNCVGALLPPIAIRRFGSRKTGLVAGFVFGLSFFISCFSPNIILLHIFQGFIAGYQSLAANISTMGIPIGGFVFSPVLEYLNKVYGWRGAVLIASAACLNVCAASALNKPLGDNSEKIPENTALVKDHRKNLARRICGVFTIPTYVILLLSSIVYSSGVVSGSIFYTTFGTNHLKLTSLKASFLLTFASSGGCVSKIVFGILGDVKRINRFLLMSAAAVVTSIVTASLTLCTTYASACAVAFLCGFFSSAYVGLFMVTYADTVGRKKLPLALGWHGCLSNSGKFLVTYLVDLALDLTDGDARVPYYISSGLFFFSSFLLLAAYFTSKNSSKQTSENSSSELRTNIQFSETIGNETSGVR